MFSEFIFIEINYKITATEGIFLWHIQVEFAGYMCKVPVQGTVFHNTESKNKFGPYKAPKQQTVYQICFRI